MENNNYILLPPELIMYIYKFANIDTKVTLHKLFGYNFFGRQPLCIPKLARNTLSEMVRMKQYRIELHNIIDTLFSEDDYDLI